MLLALYYAVVPFHDKPSRPSRASTESGKLKMLTTPQNREGVKSLKFSIGYQSVKYHALLWVLLVQEELLQGSHDMVRDSLIAFDVKHVKFLLLLAFSSPSSRTSIVGVCRH